MSDFSGHEKNKLNEEDSGGRKKVRLSVGRNLSDEEIMQTLIDRLLKKKAENPEVYEKARRVCEKAYVSWNLDKEEPTYIAPKHCS